MVSSDVNINKGASETSHLFFLLWSSLRVALLSELARENESVRRLKSV